MVASSHSKTRKGKKKKKSKRARESARLWERVKACDQVQEKRGELEGGQDLMQEATVFSMQFFTHFPSRHSSSWFSSCFRVAATTPSIPTTSGAVMTSCFTTLILDHPHDSDLRLLTITVILCSMTCNLDDTLYKCVLILIHSVLSMLWVVRSFTCYEGETW